MAGKPQLPEDWFAFVLDGRGKPKLFRVGNIKAISAEVDSWYGELRDPTTSVNKLRIHGESLRKQLLDPLVSPKAGETLFIVPDGELYRVSFAALPAEKGYLVETGLRVHMLATEGDLLLSPSPPSTSMSAVLAGAPVLADAANAVNATPGLVTEHEACEWIRSAEFAPLDHAVEELDSLRQLLESKTMFRGRIRVLEGSDATKERVAAALPDSNIIHLATHGLTINESCFNQATQRGVNLVPAKQMEGFDQAVSGLAFGGASATSSTTEVLSAEEIATIDLSKATWVVLSSCNSGIGPIVRNEGVFGMRRALRVAGARTVLLSLWPVDDAATVALMGQLYRERFIENRTTPEAIASAMQFTISSRRLAGQSDHPFYWGAFVSEGGWR
jgi:CHAT domain-containing protein